MFYNIFNTKEDTKEEKPEIIIDIHEKNSLVPAYLSEKAKTKFESLQIGDYLVGGTGIERKTWNDFISSMINKRIFTQLKEIQKYPNYLLIIEKKESIENKNLENAARGLLLSLVKQIPILFSENEKETAQFILLLANKKQKPVSLRPLKSVDTLEEQKQFILEGFPSVGQATAKKLLEKFHTIKNIINSNEQELKQILGKKYEKFKEVIE